MTQENQNPSHQTWNRRGFLCATTATATSWLSFPRLLAAAFQEPTRPRRELKQPTPRTEFLLAAAERAFEEQKPMLVVVVPRRTLDQEESQASSGLGWGLGQWFRSTRPEHLLDLGLFVPACGNAGDLQAAFHLRTDLPQPLLLLVDVRGFHGTHATVDAVPIYGSIDSLDRFKERRRNQELPQTLQQGWFNWHAEQLAQHLRGALQCRGTQALHQLAARSHLAMTREDARRLAEWIRTGMGLSDSELRRHTAALRVALRGLDAELITARRDALCDAIHNDLYAERIPGSAWGYSEGAGIVCENPQNREEEMLGGGACGQGLLIERKRKPFLILLTE